MRARLRFSPPAWGWSERCCRRLTAAHVFPPAWGWSALARINENAREVFPTRVGMVRVWLSGPPTDLGFPHPRGDGPNNPLLPAVRIRFSPPAWGWSVHGHVELARDVVFPTRVGMVRLRVCAPWLPLSFPHPRGDGPQIPRCVSSAAQFSPPAWGWSVASAAGDDRFRVFPTRVGMVLSFAIPLSET